MPSHCTTLCQSCGQEFAYLRINNARRFCDDCKASLKKEKGAKRAAKYRAGHMEQFAQQMRRWRANNPEKARANHQRSYYAHREANNARSRAYRASHQEQARVRARARYLAHRDEVLQQVKEWRENNRERSRLIGRKAVTKRRALLAGLVVEDVDIPFIINRDRGVCGICGKPIQPGKETLDHIVPIFLGGPHTPQNLRIAHESCNKSRGPGRTPGQLWLL